MDAGCGEPSSSGRLTRPRESDSCPPKRVDWARTLHDVDRDASDTPTAADDLRREIADARRRDGERVRKPPWVFRCEECGAGLRAIDEDLERRHVYFRCSSATCGRQFRVREARIAVRPQAARDAGVGCVSL